MDPYVKNPQAARNPGPFREGDRVRFLWGFTPVEGVIIEDRGNLGVGGRRLYHVRFQLDDNITEPMETEFPAEDLTLVAKAPTRSRNGRRSIHARILSQGECSVDPDVKSPSAARNPGPFREGDRVRLLWGLTPVEGVIVEDRGYRGVAGRRFYRIRVQLDENITEPMDTTLPAEDLTLVAKAPTRSRNGRRG